MKQEKTTQQQHSRISRRVFMRTGPAAMAAAYGAAHVIAPRASHRHAAPATGKRAYPDRIAFNVWINDVKSRPHIPHLPRPDPTLDDGTVEDIVKTFDLQSRAGYNMVDIFGLFAPPRMARGSGQRGAQPA